MFSFFARKASLVRQIESLESERDKLRDERDHAQSELTKFQSVKKMEEEEIKHGLKMERERAALDQQKFQAKCEAERDKGIATVKDQYRDKVEAGLREELKRIQSMYGEVLARLPDVQVKLRGGVK